MMNQMSGWKQEVASILSAQTAQLPSVSSSGFAKNQRIFHQKFGYGRIISVSGNHIEINFEKAGHKKVLADFIEAT